MRKFISFLLLTVGMFIGLVSFHHDVDEGDYKTYKILITYENCDVVELNGNSTIIMGNNSRVSQIEVIEPSYFRCTKDDVIKLYNTQFVSDDAVPSELPEGPNTIGFTIAMPESVTGEPFAMTVNINVLYSQEEHPSKTVKRLYTIKRKITKQTVDGNDITYTDDAVNKVPEGFTRYKILITYENADVKEEDGSSYVLASGETSITDVEVIEPEYTICKEILKFYNGNISLRNQLPPYLLDGFNTVSFALTTVNPVDNRATGIAVNAKILYSKSENPNKIIKRLYVIDKEIVKTTIQ